MPIDAFNDGTHVLLLKNPSLLWRKNMKWLFRAGCLIVVVLFCSCHTPDVVAPAGYEESWDPGTEYNRGVIIDE